MRQSTLSVPLEVKPESCARLSELIDQFRHSEEVPVVGTTAKFGRIARDIPALHFMSMSVFTDEHYDPLFILEVNFDGPPGAFWGQFEAALEDLLRPLIRCCKRPLDRDGILYDAVAREQSRAPIAPYLESRAQRPSVFFHGNRGMTRDHILAEADLFEQIRHELASANQGGPNPYRGAPAPFVHAGLRDALIGRFSWLAERAPARIGFAEGLLDWIKLLLFAAAALLCLALPGILLAALVAPLTFLLISAASLLLVSLFIYDLREALPGTETPSRFGLLAFLVRHPLPVLGALAAYIVVITPVAIAASLLWSEVFGPHAVTLAGIWRPVLRTVALGGLGAIVTLSGLVFWLRYLERRDSWQDDPPISERRLQEMIRREDWIAQNHMGSIVIVKPGILRTIIVHAGHLALFLASRTFGSFRRGYLGSMRTVHFAHWAFLNNHSRLLFFSNFDHSWDSYLDDFIEKAAVGLTLAWGCGIGFPPTRFLLWDGARHGRRFKSWALASRAVSRFWYSAYRDLTVDQIERNRRIADGLRKASMTEREAEAWMLDL